MLFVAASDLSPSDLALLGNNLRPPRRPSHLTPDQRQNRRVLSAVNRSLAQLHERVDHLHATSGRSHTGAACRTLAGDA